MTLKPGTPEHRDPVNSAVNESENSEKNNHFVTKFGLPPEDTLLKGTLE